MVTHAKSAVLDDLIDPGATLTCIGSGYQFTEGPVWIAAERALLFSDIPGDTRWRWTDSRGMEVDLTPTFKGNGMALDADGNLLVCEQVSSCLVRFRRDGSRELVAFHYRGRYLNSPNDVVTRGRDGSIYFTDPDYGRWNDWIGQERSRELGFRGVYRVPPGGGEIELVVAEDEFDQPNGLCFSPDESLLYVNDSGRCNVKVFDVADDGSLGAARILHEGIGTGVPREGNVDGMECDEHGNVWVTGPGGVWVLSPDGEHLGTVETPEVCGSLCWGGDDLHSLFLMTSTTVHVVRTHVGPAPLPPF
ncbi:MAG TPA: SMP-30/gluconolactonase/LRE family protein [Gaiellaceae bacterium]|nr:SMP-30/gluconolactonase/LRE family protein [Gaiellaceae bacterium]